MKKYYEIAPYESPGSWTLASPTDRHDREWDLWPLTTGRPVAEQDFAGLTFPIETPGHELAITLTTFGIPIVQNHYSQLIRDFVGDQVQQIRVQTPNSQHEYDAIVITNSVACLDKLRSEFELWAPEDERPDKTGTIRMLADRKIDASRVPTDLHVFRLSEWDVSIVFSEALMDHLAGADGVMYSDIT